MPARFRDATLASKNDATVATPRCGPMRRPPAASDPGHHATEVARACRFDAASEDNRVPSDMHRFSNGMVRVATDQRRRRRAGQRGGGVARGVRGRRRSDALRGDERGASSRLHHSGIIAVS